MTVWTVQRIHASGIDSNGCDRISIQNFDTPSLGDAQRRLNFFARMPNTRRIRVLLDGRLFAVFVPDPDDDSELFLVPPDSLMGRTIQSTLDVDGRI